MLAVGRKNGNSYWLGVAQLDNGRSYGVDDVRDLYRILDAKGVLIVFSMSLLRSDGTQREHKNQEPRAGSNTLQAT
jgi:hypothetical protein